jgi:hypothetical protein
MAQTTYRLLADLIRTEYYRGLPPQEASFSPRFVAQLISEEYAAIARQNAFENSNLGEVTYTNDTFIATFPNITVKTDSVLLTRYIDLPSIPTALPNNQEIQKVWPVGARKVQIIPITNKSKFSQDLLPPLRNKVLYYIENGRLVFDNNTAFNFGAVNVNMIGAMPDGYLLDQVILMPKNYESMLSERVMKRMLDTASRPRDVINDATIIPS